MLNQKSINRRRLIIISALLCFIFFAADSENAQSGRKPAKVKSPAPVETPTPEPTPKKNVSAKPELSLKVLSNLRQTVYRQVTFPERIQQWTVERLKNSSLLEVTAGESANMKEAKEMAKSETDTFIVLLELNENPFAAPRTSRTRPSDDVWIDFTVLTPQTAKVKQSGRSYLKPELLGGGVLNRRTSCYPSLTNEDYLLLQASFEAAERIIAGFNLPVPPLECNKTF